MASAHHRKKDPQTLRETLLRAAEDLAIAQGLPAVTMQAVSAAAGVTKGGLLHHFPSKEALLASLSSGYIHRFEAAVQHLMQQDPQPAGRFTRAYIRLCLDPALAAAERLSGGIVSAFLSDPPLRQMWYDWLATQETLHTATDAAAALRIARRAADGQWLASLDTPDPSTNAAFLAELLLLVAD